MRRLHRSNRMLSMLLCLALLLSYLPVWTISASAESNFYNRSVDANTMDNWTKYFDLDNLDTSNAGGVWTDKSVFTDASAFPSSVTMDDSSKNFLTALSAIAANKEVVGFSTVPTDTVFILDLSNSMTSTSMTQLVNATNSAINTLLSINENNRVGVVLYSGSSSNRSYSNAVSRLMPIDRYSTTNNRNVFIKYSNDTVWVDNSEVSGTKTGVRFNSKEHSGATYIQAGLWEAYKMFNEVPESEIFIGDNNWQSGDARMPIVVLMSDGAPTLGASNFADVENQTYSSGRFSYSGADVGSGNDSGITAGQSFLVQLTASYIKNRIENKYKVNEANGAGRSLFYTLGFNISNDNNPNTVTAGDIAYSVLNPDGSNITDNLWSTYNSAGSVLVQVKGRSSGNINVTTNKNSYVTSKSYVDKYFRASGNGLSDAFNNIVDEIILQSRYYPTHLEGGSPDFSGYVEFEDILGEYMEVKDIKGILLGTTLYDGHAMASKIADTSAGGLGTIENPTELGDEFIRAIKTRLGIADTADAQALVAKAFADGQFRYVSDSDWSNYIAWYAKADGTYAGFYDEDGTEAVPADAVYINRSYGFLGATTGSIKNSDMMYMSVQVHTNIESGEQTVIWRIPAALVPMITYLVSLEGTNVDTATNVSLFVENEADIAPIRLIYETGLRADLNEFNITRITEAEHLAEDGHTRVFWNNYFDISAPTHDAHITTISKFTPNKDNERFYFTFDSAVFKKNGDSYVLLGQNEVLDAQGEYYHRRYIFKENQSRPVFLYEKMSAASIAAAAWDSAFETLTGEYGAWVVPKGTPARELKMYDEQKTVNNTQSANMVFHPYISEHNNMVYVDMNLGNNGLLSVTPATGIKISKTVDIFETNTSDTFKFRVTAQVSGSYDSWITSLDETPTGAATKISIVDGVYEFEIKKDQTFWLSGVPAGTAYTVEEISGNNDYKVKSVHVNGVFTGTTATGIVAQYLIDDVDFVNTALGEGDLVITKKVVDANGNPVAVNSNVQFTAEVSLSNAQGSPLSGSFESSSGNITLQNGKYTVSLSADESFVIRGLPEMTQYTVTETNIPDGFTLNSQISHLSGVVDATSNDQALIVNTYEPTAVTGQDVSVEIHKVISGNRQNWLNGESYTFTLERLDVLRAAGFVLDTVTISYSDTEKSHLFTLTGETYQVPGTYYYRVSEATGTQGGVTYDTAERRFAVVVADADMDGDLEITAVSNELNTTVSGAWLVTANFNNVYAPTGVASATLNIQKLMIGSHSLSGYQFALYDTDPSVDAEANVFIKSGLTDADGKSAIVLNYAAVDAGNTYTYYLAEINRGQIVNNISHSDKVYKIEVTVRDNLDGTVSAETVITGLAQGETIPTFTNTYVPSASDFVTISGKKEIVGDRVLNANEFAFSIAAVTPGAPMPVTTVVKNTADGFFAFPAIEFSDAHKGNTYQYTITEVNTDPIGGFTYDASVYTVTVTVTDNGDQTITAEAAITKASNSVDNILFKNTYSAAPVDVTITGTKLLTGKTLQDNEFSFQLVPVTEGAPVPASVTVKNAADGGFSFGRIVFTKAGTFVYTLTEVNGGSANYDYDAAVYTVTITVTDNSQGALSARVELTKNGLQASEIVFRNGFVPTPITYDIYTDFGGEKVLAGRELAEGEFTFTLINAETGKQIGDAVVNDAAGAFRFPAVTLSTAGIYHLKIVEVAGDEKGITYDFSSYHIRLEVEQDEHGILHIVDKQLHKGTVTKENVGGVLTEVTHYENITAEGVIVFNNTYAADPTVIVIAGTKTLSGRDLAADEFSFELYENGSKLETVKNAADGSFAFTEIVKDSDGVYVYTVSEVAGDDTTITYDSAVFAVTVTVTDNLDGTYKVEYEYQKGNKNANGIVFENVYTRPVPTTIPTTAPTTAPTTTPTTAPTTTPTTAPTTAPTTIPTTAPTTSLTTEPTVPPTTVPQIPENPQTGDSGSIHMWFALLFISCGGIVIAMAMSRNKEEMEQN